MSRPPSPAAILPVSPSQPAQPAHLTRRRFCQQLHTASWLGAAGVTSLGSAWPGLASAQPGSAPAAGGPPAAGGASAAQGGPGPQDTSVRQEVVLGQSAPLSGLGADTGAEMAMGVRICIEHFNAQGGLRGVKVRHVALDDGYEVDRTVNNTRELLGTHNAIALIGLAGTANMLKMIGTGLLAESGAPLIGPYSGSEPLRTPFNPNIFHIRAGYNEEIAAIIKMLGSTGVTRIGVMYQDDAFGLAGYQAVEAALKPLGHKPLVSATYQRLSADVTQAVQTIAAKQPQAVILISVNKSSAAFITQYRALSRSALIFNVSVINPMSIAKIAGQLDTRGFSIAQVVPSPLSRALPVAREYRELLAKYGGGMEPGYTSFETFLAAKVFIEGLRRAKPLSRAGLMAGLESITNFDLGGYNVNFGTGNRRGSKFVQMVSISREGRLIY